MKFSLNNIPFWVSFLFIVISPIENILRIESIVYIIGTSLLAIFWLMKKRFKIKRKTIPLVLFITYCVLSCLWTPANAFGSIVPTAAAFLFLILQLQFDYSAEQYVQIKNAFVLQWMLLIILCCCYGTYMDGRFWLRSEVSGADPNYLSGWFILPVCFGIEKITSRRTKWPLKLFLLILLGMSVYFVFQSGSRSGLISIAVCIIFSFLYSVKSTIKHNPVRAVAILIVFVILVNFAINNMPDIMLSRLENSDANLGGRGALWISLLLNYLKSGIGIVTGLGYGSTVFYNDGHVTAHNTYLDVLFNTGAIGLTCLLTFFFSSSRHLIHRRPYTLIAVGAMTILAMTLSALNTRFFMLSYFLLGIDINPKDKSKCMHQESAFD